MPEPPEKDTVHMLRAVAEFLKQYFPQQMPDNLEVQIVSLTRGGRVVTLFLPRDMTLPSARAADETADDLPPVTAADRLRECEQDILEVVGEAGERLTGDAIKERLEKAGRVHGDSTITHALADMVRRRKVLSNRRDSYGRGYGLADWS